ncbi:MAG: CopG family transcriptional regulator [Streptosporangiaceae bacterium]
MTVSASLNAGTVEAVRRRVGKRGFSSYVEAALRRQIEQDNLTELVQEYTSAEGDFTAEELAAARADLYGSEDTDAGHAA